MNIINDILQKSVRDCTNDLIKKQENIILLKLQEHGIDIDLKEEAKRRFKRITIETGPQNKMEVWYNDGSEQGLRIVTFHTEYVPDVSGVKMQFKYF